MTCKAGTELLRKVAVPTVAAIALMLCTTLSARPQAGKGQLGVMIFPFADGNTYACNINVVATPTKGGSWPLGNDNWSCMATLTDGTPVTGTVKGEGFALADDGSFGFLVDVTERSDGTANVKAHI